MTHQVNGYAALVRKRTADKGKNRRRKLDDYETPEADTARLTRFIRLQGPILEPACGSGRMVRALRKYTGHTISSADIKFGDNFLERTEHFKGDIVSNPPYRDGLAEKFARKALELADGRVAMLMQSGFLFGGRRARGLYSEFRPEAIILIPDRIYFFEAGTPIKSQFFTHVWVVWPKRSTRLGNNSTATYWG